MKKCPACSAEMPDTSVFCFNCGTKLAPAPAPENVNPAPNPNVGYAAPNSYSQTMNNGFPNGAPAPQPAVPSYDPDDHTAEFDPADIRSNKLYAICAYLGVLMIVPLLVAKDSPFVMFHVRQALKVIIASTAVIFAGAILSITVLVPIAAVIACVILAVINIIGFINAGRGLAKELPIVKKIGFLD